MELMDFGFPQLFLYISTCIAVVAVEKEKDVMFEAYTPVRQTNCGQLTTSRIGNLTRSIHTLL